ncbi:PAS domain-containing protein, partial [Pseudomonas sp. CrR25]|nr:PAS domain-containing protein [Pseudomonas sp. CrR25]
MPIAAAGNRALEHQLRQIVDNSSAVIYVKGLDGRLQLVNHAFEQLFRRRAEELLGCSDHELFPAQVADVLRANDQRVALQGEAMEFEEHLQVGEASCTYLSTKFPLFDDAGRVTAVCGI